MNDKYIYFLLGLLTLFIQLQLIIAESSEVIVKCELSRNEIWKERKGKCKKCKPCEAKKGINLNSVPEHFPQGIHGYTKCLECGYCPTYFYARDSICRPCTLDKCAKLNRHVRQECSRDTDVECSSECLPGFISLNGRRDFYFPCETKNTSHQVTIINASSRKAPTVTAVSGPNSRATLDNDEDDGTIDTVIAILTVTGVILTSSILGVIIYCSKRNTKPKKQATVPYSFIPHSGMPLLSNSTPGGYINSNDIETDGPKDSRVRGELPTVIHISENSHLLPTNRYYNNAPNEIPAYQPRQKRNCHCIKIDPCNNCITDYDDMLVTTDMIPMLAKNVCHYPENMFDELGIPDPIVFARNRDRDRDVQNITEPEYITKVLLDWVTENQENAKLTNLSKALCKHDFHHINAIIYEHCCKTNPTPKLHQYPNNPCKCSIKSSCETCITQYSNIPLNDNVIDIVSENLCHCPEKMFQEFCVPIVFTFPKECENIKECHYTKKQSYSTWLKKWACSETASPKATLTELSNVLCKHGFHHINDKLHDFYFKQYPTMTRSIAENSIGNKVEFQQCKDRQDSETFEYLPST